MMSYRNQTEARAIFRAMGWTYAGHDGDYHLYKSHDADWAESERFFEIDSTASVIASHLNLVVDFRRGFVEAPTGHIKQFDIAYGSDCWWRAVFEIAAAIGSAMPEPKKGGA